MYWLVHSLTESVKTVDNLITNCPLWPATADSLFTK